MCCERRQQGGPVRRNQLARESLRCARHEKNLRKKRRPGYSLMNESTLVREPKYFFCGVSPASCLNRAPKSVWRKET